MGKRNKPVRGDAGHTTAGPIYHECIIYICKHTFMYKYISRNAYVCVCVYIYIYAFIFWVVLKEGIKKNLRSQQKY